MNIYSKWYFYFNKTSLESISCIGVYGESISFIICFDMDPIEAIFYGDYERIIVFDDVNQLYSLGALDDKLIAWDRGFVNT